MGWTWQGAILAGGLAVGAVSLWSAEAGAKDTAPPRGVLLGTVVADDPSLSSALIAPTIGGISRGYAIGSRFHGWRVVRIERSRIQLRHDDGARAWFEIGSTEGPRSESTGPELDAVEVPGFHYAVGPELLKSEMASEPTFRALIHRGVDGEIDGFRLSGIRSSSLAARLHLENGDIVHAVDGQPLAEIVTGSEVLTRLGETGSVCMSVTRRREPLQICYHLTTE